jgi:hypothetical protein
MKRFAIFAGSDYESLGGWNDLAGTADTRAQAAGVMAEAVRQEIRGACWAQIVDLELGEIVDRFPIKRAEGQTAAAVRPARG